MTKVKALKAGAIIMITILTGITIVLIMADSLGSLLAIATGFLILYYVIILIASFILTLNGKMSSIAFYITLVMFFIPIIWVLVDGEGLINFLMQGVHLDMK